MRTRPKIGIDELHVMWQRMGRVDLPLVVQAMQGVQLGAGEHRPRAESGEQVGACQGRSWHLVAAWAVGPMAWVQHLHIKQSCDA